MKRPASPLRVIIVDGSAETGHRLLHHLQTCGFPLSGRLISNSAEIPAAFSEHDCDLVVANHDSPNFDPFDLLQMVENQRPDTPVIFVSEEADDSVATGLMSAGARDFVSGDNFARLEPVIEREIRDMELRGKTNALMADLGESNRELTATLHVLRKTQEQLLRTERFKALGQMASGVAHDFNNALTRMMGIIEVMTARSPVPGQPLLQQLKTTVHEATNIVRRLRAFYKPSEIIGELEPTNLNDVIKATVALTKPKWKVQSEVDGNPVTMNLSLDAVPSVVGQFYELREAFALVIFNACDAMPQGGSISISTREEEGNVVVARVEDRGTGMTEEVRRRCLEPYFSTKGETRSGLGLALVDELVRRYGGKLEVDSAIGQGTTVILRLPVSEPAARAVSVPQAAPQVTGHLHILVAEDDLTVSVLLSQFLILDGHTVDLARDGREALERFDPERHRLVISDRAMPSLNGEQLAAGIKARSPLTPVILASGYDDALSADDKKPGGVDYLLPKPITREDLRRAVGAVIQGD